MFCFYPLDSDKWFVIDIGQTRKVYIFQNLRYLMAAKKLKRRKCRLCGCSEKANEMREKPVDGKPIRVCESCYHEMR